MKGMKGKGMKGNEGDEGEGDEGEGDEGEGEGDEGEGKGVKKVKGMKEGEHSTYTFQGGSGGSFVFCVLMLVLCVKAARARSAGIREIARVFFSTKTYFLFTEDNICIYLLFHT
jgi:hypothetical protein